MDKQTALRQYFGHDTFRPGQEALIDALLGGRDVLGVMPTGAGKSVCYQIPALLLGGVTLVISPLISLMKDQVAALGQAGVDAAFINSSLSAAQCREAFRRARAGQYKIVYVAPERLETADFIRFAQSAEIPLVAVDEAHCVSQWGQDFRPGYLKIAEFLEGLPARPAVGAFTATATEQVKEDIVRLLGLREPLSLTTGFDRPNLYFGVEEPKSKSAWLTEYVARHRDKSGIVYCATRKTVESVCAGLQGRGIAATRYHAGLTDGERRQNQEDFVYDRKQVMVATNAFGMGIDKSNVGFVVHYNMPKDVESYYQEAGRAGRDGEPADCILLFSYGDIQMAKLFIRNSEDNGEMAEEEREAVRLRDMERLRKMAAYCKTEGCLRAFLLGYFGEKAAAGGNCGNCGNCRGGFLRKDVTVEAQKILSGVARVEKKHPYGLGAAVILQMLAGSREQRVLSLGLDGLSTYGILQGYDKRALREIVDHLIEKGYLEKTQGEYPALHLKPAAGNVLFRGERVSLRLRRPEEPEPQAGAGGSRRRGPAAPPVASGGLFDALRALRTKLAGEDNVPAYIVFSNAALADMAAKRPGTMAEFREVSGVGEVKAARYGEAFLAAIREYAEQENGGDETEESGEDGASGAAGPEAEAAAEGISERGAGEST